MSRVFRFTLRTKTRRCTVDAVFEADQRGMGRDSEILRDLLRQRRVIATAETPLPEYSIQTIEGAADDLRRTDDLIVIHTKVSGLDRIAAVDLTVVRVAVWEMLENSEDIFATIAIDEAISIVKPLSTDATPSLVNAALDVIRKDLETPARTRREASVVKDEPALDSEGGPTLDLENEGEESTGEHDDTEDAPLSPELAKPDEEGSTDELNDEGLAEFGELLDKYRSTHTPRAADHESGPP